MCTAWAGWEDTGDRLWRALYTLQRSWEFYFISLKRSPKGNLNYQSIVQINLNPSYRSHKNQHDEGIPEKYTHQWYILVAIQPKLKPKPKHQWLNDGKKNPTSNPSLTKEQYMLFPGSSINFLQLLEAVDPSVSSLYPRQQRKDQSLSSGPLSIYRPTNKLWH